MALVTNGWWLRASLADNGANVTTKRYELQATTAIQAALDVPDIIAALNDVTDSVIQSYAYGEEFAEDTLVYPVAGVENENKASVTCALDAGGGKKANFKIPAPKIGIMLAPSGSSANIVDVLDVDLLEYGALFAAGGQAYISDGETISSMLHGKRISAKSNNG